VIHRSLALLLLIVCIGCKKPGTGTVRPAEGPQVRATVLTIRTTSEPEKSTRSHAIVITNERARSLHEQDLWRLYHLNDDRVAFVDEIAKTTRERSVAELAREKTRALAGDLPAHYPRARFVVTDERKPILGVQARKHVIEAGGYRRELWVADHQAIPDTLFAKMVTTEAATTPLAPMMRTVDEALMKLRGFPLVDRTEVTYGETKMVVERAVVGIEQKPVAEALVTLPDDYRDLTPREKKK
jgi:hypothetical protein